MKVWTVLLWAVVLPAANALADELPFDISATDLCLASPEGQTSGQSCIGASAEACREATSGSNGIGYADCLEAEAIAWDLRLDAAYAARMGEAETRDATSPSAVSLASFLGEAQEAWTRWRDTNCNYVATLSNDTELTRAECRMTMTAERALDLGWKETAP